MTKKPVREDWSARYSAFLAKRLRELRAERGMSAQRLSDACAALGYPIARAVLSNYENGRRDGMDVREMLVLAQALGVTPFELLMAPDARTELLPGDYRTPTEALAWMTGFMPPPSEIEAAAKRMDAAADAAATAEKAFRSARDALAAVQGRQVFRPTPRVDADDYDDSAGVL